MKIKQILNLNNKIQNINVNDEDNSSSKKILTQIINEYNQKQQKKIRLINSNSHKNIRQNGLLPTSIENSTSQKLLKNFPNINNQQLSIIKRITVKQQRSQSSQIQRQNEKQNDLCIQENLDIGPQRKSFEKDNQEQKFDQKKNRCGSCQFQVRKKLENQQPINIAIWSPHMQGNKIHSNIVNNTKFVQVQQKHEFLEKKGNPNQVLLDNLNKKLSQFVYNYSPLKLNSKLLIDISLKNWDNELANNIKQLNVEDFLQHSQSRINCLNLIFYESIIPEIKRILKEKYKLDLIEPNYVQCDIIKIVYQDLLSLIGSQQEMIISLKDKMGLKAIDNEDEDTKEKFFEDFLKALKITVLIKSYSDEPQKKQLEQCYSEELNGLIRGMKYKDTDLKVREYLDVFRKVENLFQEMQQKIEKKDFLIDQQNQQIKDLKKFISSNQFISSEETNNCLQKYEEMLNSQQGIRKTIGQLDLIEKNQKTLIKKYQNQIQKLEKQLELYNQQNGKKNMIQNEQENARKSNLTTEQSLEQNMQRGGKRQKTMKFIQKEFVNSGIQTIFIQPNQQLKSDGIDNIVPSILTENKDQLQGYLFSEDCMIGLINMIVSQKLVSDYENHQILHIQHKNMKEFLKEFFLEQFGNCSLAEQFLRDFYSSLQKYEKKHQRYRTINLLSGILNSAEKQDLEKEKQQQGLPYFPVKFEHLYFNSSEGVKIYNKLYFLLRFATLEKEDSFKPSMPNFLLEDEELIPNEVALEACRIILIDENIHKYKIEEFCLNYEYHLQQDIIERRKIAEFNKQFQINLIKEYENLPISYMKPKKKQGIDTGMRIDSIAKMLLDFIAIQKTNEINKLITSVKIIQQGRDVKDFFSTDIISALINTYQHTKSDKWMQQIFIELVCKNSKCDMSDLNKLFEPIYSDIIQPNYCSKKFYIDFVFNDYFENLQAKGILSQQKNQEVQQIQNQKGLRQSPFRSQINKQSTIQTQEITKENETENTGNEEIYNQQQEQINKNSILKTSDKNVIENNNTNQKVNKQVSIQEEQDKEQNLQQNDKKKIENWKNQDQFKPSQQQDEFARQKFKRAQTQVIQNSQNKTIDISLKKDKRHIFKFNMEGYLEIIPQILKIKSYDVVSSIIVLEESYLCLKKIIQKGETKRDSVQILHDKFKQEFLGLPKKLQFVKQYDQYLMGQQRIDLVTNLERIWALFRSLCDHAISKVASY